MSGGENFRNGLEPQARFFCRWKNTTALHLIQSQENSARLHFQLNQTNRAYINASARPATVRPGKM